MSQGHNHLNHATWECKYHVVFTPKYRKKVLFGQRIVLGADTGIEPGHTFGSGEHVELARCREPGRESSLGYGPRRLQRLCPGRSRVPNAVDLRGAAGSRRP